MDSRLHRHLADGTTALYLYERGVKYVVLPTGLGPGDLGYATEVALDPSHGVNLAALHSACADEIVSRVAFTSSLTAMRCETVYSIQYRSVAEVGGLGGG